LTQSRDDHLSSTYSKRGALYGTLSFPLPLKRLTINIAELCHELGVRQ
jgi:hypothetical protein